MSVTPPTTTEMAFTESTLSISNEDIEQIERLRNFVFICLQSAREPHKIQQRPDRVIYLCISREKIPAIKRE